MLLFRLCSDAIHLLITLSEARAQSLARNELFYSSLAHVNIENLPVRRSLVKSLVLIGSNVESDDVRQKMYTTVSSWAYSGASNSRPL